MIAPRQKSEPDSVQHSVRDEVDAFFCPGGALEHACQKAQRAFELRPEQRQMAGAVADTVELQRHLAVEAGTGVGKSFAYLVPLILMAVDQKVQAVVSTYTISLQEQLMYKDIPFLKQHMGIPFKAALVKGRSNYLCLRRLARTRRMEGDLFKAGKSIELDRVQDWAQTTREGSLQDMDEQPSTDVWSSVCVEHGNCLYQRCPEYKSCFFMRARAEISDAHLLIVNHHLLFSDLALRVAGGSFLPDYTYLVVDEAHQMEAVASDHLGIRLSQYMFEHWLRRLYVPDSKKGILAYLQKGDPVKRVTRLGDEILSLFVEVDEWASFTSGPQNQRVVPQPLTIRSRVPESMDQLIRSLKETAADLKDQETQAELHSCIRRGEDMRNALHAFLNQSCEDHVYWVEQQGARRRQLVLYAAPIEVGPALRDTLFSEVPCVVMTSATLSIGGDLTYFQKRVGADGKCDGLNVGSLFNYPRQMRVIITRLPFAVPDQPLVKVRMDRIKEQGGDRFATTPCRRRSLNSVRASADSSVPRPTRASSSFSTRASSASATDASSSNPSWNARW